MQVEPNKFDDVFTDKAWQQMAVILDKEMPVKKRRPFLWIWFLLGFGGLIGTGIVYQMNATLNQESKEKEINNPTVIPIEQAQLPILKEDLDYSITENRKASIKNIRPNNYIGIQQVNGDLSSSFTAKTYFKEDKNLSQIAVDTIQQSIITKENNLVQEQEITDIIPNVVIPLSSSSIKPIFFSKNEYNITTPIHKIRKNNFQYGVNAGMYFASNQKDGLFGGFSLAYKLAKKWQITIGSDYFMPTILNTSANDEAAKMDSSSGRGGVSITANEQDAEKNEELLINNDYSFIQFPIQLEYKLFNRWQIASGLAWTIPLGNSDDQNQLQEHFFTNSTANPKVIQPSPSLNWTLGVYYQLHSKWEAQLQYQNNLTDYKNSLLMGSINYHLGK